MKNNFALPVIVGDKYQIDLPQEAVDMFDIQPGEKLILLGDKNQGIALMTGEMAHKKMGPVSSKILNDVINEE